MKKIEGNPLPQGVSEMHSVVNFSIAVKSGKECTLCIYKKNEEEPEYRIQMLEENSVGDVRYYAFPKTQVTGKEYLYEIDGELILDPYVKSFVDTPYGRRGKVCNSHYDWEGDKPLQIPYQDVVAYSLHVRGFTKHRSSEVRKKGTFKGMVEKIPYLKELGINQVQCMPVYAFLENEKYENYWGYGEAFCFALKSSYAASKEIEKEFKDTIKVFHKNGMEVVLNMPFSDNTPKQMMMDALRFFVMEYHIDGFVLNPGIAPMECVLSDEILKNTKILQNNSHFQDTMRQFLRGDKEMLPDVMQELRKTAQESRSCNYITNHTGFTLRDLVSYNRKHNEANGENNCDGPVENYSWNCGKEGNSNKEEIVNLRKRQMRNALALLMFSQGTPCLLAGDEFENTQNGNNNVYCQDNEIAWLNWSQLKKDSSLYEYVKNIIRIRKDYLHVYFKEMLTGMDTTGCGIPDMSFHGESAWKIDNVLDDCGLGVYYHGKDDSDCFIAYNMYNKERRFALPQLKKGKTWHQIFTTSTDSGVKEVVESNQQTTCVEARTIVMFVGR